METRTGFWIQSRVLNFGHKSWEVTRFDAENSLLDEGKLLYSLDRKLMFSKFSCSRFGFSLQSYFFRYEARWFRSNSKFLSTVPSPAKRFFYWSALLPMALVVFIGLKWSSTGFMGPEACQGRACICFSVQIGHDGEYSYRSNGISSASEREKSQLPLT